MDKFLFIIDIFIKTLIVISSLLVIERISKGRIQKFLKNINLYLNKVMANNLWHPFGAVLLFFACVVIFATKHIIAPLISDSWWWTGVISLLMILILFFKDE